MNTLAILLCVVAAAATVQARTVSLRGHLQKSTEKDLVYNERKGIKAVFQLNCFTGPNENGFELHVRRGDSYSRSTNGYLEVLGRQVADPGADQELVATGSLSDLTKTDTNEVCDETNYGATPKACSKKYCGRANLQQFVLVPGSQSPLAWVGQYEVDFCCLWSPEDDKKDLIEPEINEISLSQCTTFGFEIIISPLPGPAACDIQITTEPTGPARKGMGYALQSCRVTSDVNPANVIPLVQNGRAVNGNGYTVEARQVGNVGRSYDLKVHGLPVNSGKVDCDIIHCRFDNSLPMALPICPEGALPVENVAGKSLAPVRSASGALNLRQGAVTLNVPTADGTGQQTCQ